MSAVVPGTGSTSFEEMSHERMLAWLDQANPGTVRFAADRLTAAAEEIRRIGEELKVRPQYADWQGEGADVFRTWAGDLANSTLRLGDFSADAAKWLGQASDAIAHAQAAIPRDTKSARANLNAAPLAHNAPDAAAGTAVNAKSAGELAASSRPRRRSARRPHSRCSSWGSRIGCRPRSWTGWSGRRFRRRRRLCSRRTLVDAVARAVPPVPVAGTPAPLCGATRPLAPRSRSRRIRRRG